MEGGREGGAQRRSRGLGFSQLQMRGCGGDRGVFFFGGNGRIAGRRSYREERRRTVRYAWYACMPVRKGRGKGYSALGWRDGDTPKVKFTTPPLPLPPPSAKSQAACPCSRYGLHSCSAERRTERRAPEALERCELQPSMRAHAAMRTQGS